MESLYIHSKKKRNFTKPKKELSAGTASEPLVVSEKEGFVPNFFLMNGKNGFVRKVQYETFTEKRLKGFARNVQYETIPKWYTKGFVHLVSYDTLREISRKRFRHDGFVQNLPSYIHLLKDLIELIKRFWVEPLYIG